MSQNTHSLEEMPELTQADAEQQTVNGKLLLQMKKSRAERSCVSVNSKEKTVSTQNNCL